MTETPSGNRWEPTEEGTQPLAPTAQSSQAPPPPAVEPPSEYGWAPAATPAEPVPPRRDRRRTGVLAAWAAALVLGVGAGGYAIGSATAAPDHPDVGTTRQAPPDGFGPGQGIPGQDGRDDHDQFGGPDGSTDGDAE